MEAKQRGLPVPQVLPSEKKKLTEKACKMANSYAQIIFSRKAEAAQPNLDLTRYMKLKTRAVGNLKQEKDFYEVVLRLLCVSYFDCVYSVCVDYDFVCCTRAAECV